MIAYGNYEILLGIPSSPNLKRPAEARVYGAKCVALARAEMREDPNDARAKRDLGMSLGRLGMLDPEPNKAAESLATLREARGLTETIAKANRRLCGGRRPGGHLSGIRRPSPGGPGPRPEAIVSCRESVATGHPFLD
jgi:hypothetical protein